MPSNFGIMKIIIQTLIALIALQHIWFLILEMFLWKSPMGLKTFGNTPQKAEVTQVLAANQGLYNGFLAAGLIASFFISTTETIFAFQVFFLACIGIAGLYGGYSFSKKIAYVQALPAIFTLILVLYF